MARAGHCQDDSYLDSGALDSVSHCQQRWCTVTGSSTTLHCPALDTRYQ